MKIQVTSGADAARSDLLVVLLPEGKALKLDSEAGKLAAGILRRKEWKAGARKSLLLFGDGGKERLLLVGLGKEKEVDTEGVRRAAAVAGKRSTELSIKTIGFRVETNRVKGAALGSAVAEALTMASYRVPARRKEKDEDKWKGLTFRVGADSQDDAVKGGVERGTAVGESANLARELGDMPGNVLTPTVLAERATRMARAEGLKAKVHRKKDLERMRMGGILGVNRGSHEPPVLIELTYQPRRFEKTVCLVGKGLTFDTGGISLKPSANMEEMKYDMCGGAAVVGAMRAVARLKPNVKVIGIIPSTDNMPGGMAQKPGDTLVTASGHTVEVINTDAEGRLILADGLWRATSYDPDHIVDLATLTGACVIALGHDATGLYSNDDKLSKALTEAGKTAGDVAWRMPLFPEYDDDLKSSVADLKNLGGREGGAGTAGAFLKNFVGDTSWAHLDIAGTAWGARDRDYVGGKLASGSGVRLLVQWLESLG